RNAARRLGKEKLHRRAASLVRWRLQHAVDVELVAAAIDDIRVMVPTVGGSRDRTGGEYGRAAVYSAAPDVDALVIREELQRPRALSILSRLKQTVETSRAGGELRPHHNRPLGETIERIVGSDADILMAAAPAVELQS